MKTTLSLFFFFFFFTSFGQNVFYDDFSNYTVNSNLSGQGTWTNNSSNPAGLGVCSGFGCVNTQVKNFAISYTGYGSSNSAINIAPSGDATGTVFSSISSGTAYFSFVLNFSNAVLDPNNSSSTDFFRVMGAGNYNTLFRLSAYKVGSNFVLALQKESGTKVLTSALNFNTNYLVVMKYTFNPGTTDDAVSLFLNPDISSTEPTPSITTTLGSNLSEFTSIDRMNFRTNWAVIPTGYIGLVSVSKSWNSLLSTSNFSSQNNIPLNIISNDIKNGTISIKFDPIKYQNPNYSIYTIDGKNILNGTFFSNIESNIESISITSLNKGTYIFVLEENGHKETKKFIIN
jgi:hypothetical protein